MSWCRSILDKVSLAGLPPERRQSYSYFACAQLVALGSHQFIVPVKTALFLDSVGTQMEPVARSFVLVVLLPVLLLYGLAASLVADPRKLVLLVCSAFAALYGLVVLGLLLPAATAPTWPAWLLYYATEAKGVIVMPMVWSVLADVSTPELASKAYPLIFFVIQLGGILGSLAALKVRNLGGELGLLVLQALCLLAVAGLSWRGCDLLGDGDPETAAIADAALADSEGGTGGLPVAQQRRTSPLSTALCGVDGLWLLLSRPYVLGAFWVSYASLVPRTILDYQTGVRAVATFPERSRQIACLGQVNLLTSATSAFLTLVGTRPVVDGVGVGHVLLVLPLAMAGCISALCLGDGLWVSVWASVASSAVAYSLNSPAKELLFVRTSRDIKYKAKAWSEMYGNQVMKLVGAQVNLWVNLETDQCRPKCFHRGPTSISMTAWVGIWLAVASYVGQEYARLERDGKKVS